MYKNIQYEYSGPASLCLEYNIQINQHMHTTDLLFLNDYHMNYTFKIPLQDKLHIILPGSLFDGVCVSYFPLHQKLNRVI